MVYIPEYGWLCNFGSLFNTKPKKSLWCLTIQLMWEVGKGCSESKKWYWFMNSNMVKPGIYDHSIHFLITLQYTTIFNLVINFLVGWWILNSLLDKQIGLFLNK